MEVLEEGTVPYSWSKDFHCTGSSSKGQNGTARGCNALLRITEEDLVTRHGFGTHFRHDYLAFECPLCGEFTFVKRKDIPTRIFYNRWDEKKSTFDGEDYRIY